MNTSVSLKYRPLVGLVGLLLIGLLFFQFIRASGLPSDSQAVARKVNLALRRTAHLLLTKAGDSTSRIPPVQQSGLQTFQIQLGHHFDYNALPNLLQESFRLHQVSGNYDVSVIDCQKGELQLGYTMHDFLKNGKVTCGGRSQREGCYRLQITFLQPAANQIVNRWWFLVGGSLLAILLVTFYRRTVPMSLVNSPGTAPPLSPETGFTEPTQAAVVLNWLVFGNSRFDFSNQLLQVGDQQHELTYREAKLLRLFVSHLNQLLERDFILKSVWEDEGIIVGRSADVFVSRLRKLLKDDPTIRIMAVHGVGYRMEVKTV